MTKAIQIAPRSGAFGIKIVMFESLFVHFEKTAKTYF